MREFFTSLLCAAVIGGIGSALVGKAYRRHFRAFAAILCCAVTVYPLFSVLPKFSESLPEYDGVSVDAFAAESLVLSQAKSDAEDALLNYIFTETGIKVKALSIEFESKEQQIHITKVFVRVATSAEAETVRALLVASCGNDTTVEVEGED